MQKLYLEDLNIGDQWTSREYTLTRDDIKGFAEQYDPQPFHLDEAAAKDTFFAGIAASGWQTASVTMRLMVETMPIGSGLIGASGQIKWPRPTRPNDTLHAVIRIAEIRLSKSKSDRGIVTVKADTINQHGEFVQQFTCELIAFRRPQNMALENNAAKDKMPQDK